MLKVEKLTVHGFEEAIRGMRNPYDSWDKSDTTIDYETGSIDVGDNDILLMRKLVAGGPVHAKFRRMITVSMDITAPLYWWKEFDTYKVGTVANSCSTMHTIMNKEFTPEDFSCEHLLSADDIDRDPDNGAIPDTMKLENIPTLAAVLVDGSEAYYTPYGFLAMTCDVLNHFRELYLKTKDKRYWWQMIQLLPSSYNQKRTVMLNYEVLANIYMWRKNHKLDEWHQFIDAISVLPLFDILIKED